MFFTKVICVLLSYSIILARAHLLNNGDVGLPRKHSQMTHEVSNSFVTFKDFALKFDEELGRGDAVMTSNKMEELDNNLIEMAELLHFFPEGSVDISDLPKHHELLAGSLSVTRNVGIAAAKNDPNPLFRNRKPALKAIKKIPARRVRKIRPVAYTALHI